MAFIVVQRKQWAEMGWVGQISLLLMPKVSFFFSFLSFSFASQEMSDPYLCNSGRLFVYTHISNPLPDIKGERKKETCQLSETKATDDIDSLPIKCHVYSEQKPQLELEILCFREIVLQLMEEESCDIFMSFPGPPMISPPNHCS